MTNMMPFIQFGQNPSVPKRVVPIPKVELLLINVDHNNQQEMGFKPILTPDRGFMWVHLDLVEEATQPSKKKGRTCNVILASSKKADCLIPTSTH